VADIAHGTEALDRIGPATVTNVIAAESAIILSYPIALGLDHTTFGCGIASRANHARVCQLAWRSAVQGNAGLNLRIHTT
jgi:hypothetical protein